MSRHVFDTQFAERTVKNYVCSACWGHLIQKIIPGDNFRSEGTLVECYSCEEETPGFVTQHYANRRRDDSVFEKRDVTRLLRKVGVIENPHAGKSTEETLKEMGF